MAKKSNTSNRLAELLSLEKGRPLFLWLVTVGLFIAFGDDVSNLSQSLVEGQFLSALFVALSVLVTRIVLGLLFNGRTGKKIKRRITERERNRLVGLVFGIAAYSFLSTPINTFIANIATSAVEQFALGLGAILVAFYFFDLG